MEILIVNPFFHPYHGGTEKMLMEIGRRLSKKHSLTVLTAKLHGTADREEVSGMDVVRLPARIFYSAPHPIPPPVPLIFGSESWLRSNIRGYDVVHINNRFIYSPAFGSIVADSGSKLCLTIHNSRPKGIDLLSDAFGAVYDDLVAKRLMRSCHGIAGVSNDALHATIPRDYKGATATIYNGVDYWTFSPGCSTLWRDKLGVEGQIVLTNVRLIQQKGVPYLIDAMKGIDATLVIFGRGPLKEALERQAKAAGVRAIFVGEKITDRELAELYRAADCFVMPSLYDPCPLALLEGMGAGRPCVVTSAGGMKELVQDGRSGIVVPAADSRALHDAMVKVLGDKKLADSFGREARKRVLASLNWEKAADSYSRFYESLL